MENITKDKINNKKEISSNINNDYQNINTKKIEERRNRFSGLTSYELLKIVKQTSGFPKNL